MERLIRSLVILLPLLAGGCTDLQPIIEALAKDPNPVCVKVTSIWVSATLDRIYGCESAPAGK